MHDFKWFPWIACYSGTGAVILGTGYSSYGLEIIDFTTGVGNGGISYSFTAQSAKVGVDTETGKITTADFTIASDCGRLLSPIIAEGQIEGAAGNAGEYSKGDEREGCTP